MTLPAKIIRRETGLIEAICSEHGVGHPVYGSAHWLSLVTDNSVDTWMVHGCCGCCNDTEWQMSTLETSVEIANQLVLDHKELIEVLTEIATEETDTDSAASEESVFIIHARKELELAGLFDSDSDYGGLLGESVLELVQVFADQGHSGLSASIAIKLFGLLASFEPLTPLTYKEDEWEKHDPDFWQNNRKADVFTYDQGKTWHDNAGNTGSCLNDK